MLILSFSRARENIWRTKMNNLAVEEHRMGFYS